MVERAGPHPEKPVTPAQVKQESAQRKQGEVPQQLAKESKHTSKVVLGSGMLGAGRSQYSKNPTGESGRVSQFALGHVQKKG